MMPSSFLPSVILFFPNSKVFPTGKKKKNHKEKFYSIFFSPELISAFLVQKQFHLQILLECTLKSKCYLCITEDIRKTYAILSEFTV